MFKHEKQLFHPVAVERPNPQYAALLQEQLGGGNGELKAAMQYLSQSFRKYCGTSAGTYRKLIKQNKKQITSDSGAQYTEKEAGTSL